MNLSSGSNHENTNNYEMIVEDINESMGNLSLSDRQSQRSMSTSPSSVPSRVSAMTPPQFSESEESNVFMDEAEFVQKNKLLQSILKLEQEGFPCYKACDLNSSINHLQTQFQHQLNSREAQKSVDNYQQALNFGVMGIENITKWQNVVDIYLDGWHESWLEEDVQRELRSVCVELDEKYGTMKSFPPEVRLAILVGRSAIRVHSTNKALKASGVPAATTPPPRNPEATVTPPKRNARKKKTNN